MGQRSWITDRLNWVDSSLERTERERQAWSKVGSGAKLRRLSERQCRLAALRSKLDRLLQSSETGPSQS